MKRLVKNYRLILFFLLGVVGGLEWMEVFKPSLRSRIIYGLLKLFYKPEIIEVAKQRGYLDGMRKGMPSPAHLIPKPVDAGGVPAEWVVSDDEISNQVVFYLHGGAYVTRMPVLHRSFLHLLANESDAQFLMIDYRLAPEFPFPAALDDALTAYRWLLNQGYDPKQIVFAGDSAGGGLTLATLIAARDRGYPLPASAILLSPWTDLLGTGDAIQELAEEDVLLSWQNLEECALDYAGSYDRGNPLISPLYADLSGLPPMLVQVGGSEILRDDSTRLVEKIQQAGGQAQLVIEPFMGHVYPAYAPSIPEAVKAVQQIAAFIRKS
ncbi:MAG: hypothetical protein CL609_05330 [Anaerolineaceae bacterium]|nr:hypothetical protein [Anaerolineaceae bacterium]